MPSYEQGKQPHGGDSMALEDPFRLAATEEASFRRLFSSINETTDPVKPRHLCKDAVTCEMVSLELGNLTRITGLVESGEFPVLTYSSKGTNKKKLRMRLKSRSEQFLCVAISHVRTDGLGNDEANALPTCVMQWLQNTVNEMYDTSEHPVAFWIDTICLPIQRSFRKSVIKHLRQTFSDCDRVLVLETSLYNSAAASPADQLLLIKNSAWLTRLWTLQEGAVARQLYFRFQKNFQQLEPLLEASEGSEGCRVHTPDSPRNLEQTLPTFIDLDILGLLDDDIKSFESSLTNTAESASTGVKYQLRSILRLGYLSLPRFRAFATVEERAMFSTVLSAVRETYKDRPKGKQAAFRLQKILGHFPVPERALSRSIAALVLFTVALL